MEEKTKELDKELENKPINEPENALSEGGEVESGEGIQQPQQLTEAPQQPTEQIKIGDLLIASCRLDAGQLVSIAHGLLKEKHIIDYLEGCKTRKTATGSYFG